MPDPHESIVQSACSGDAVAVEVLLERHLPGLEGFLRLNADKVVRQRESLSDVAQSVCREVLEEMHLFEYRGEAQFRHWLFSLARSKLIDRIRRWKSAGRDLAREEPRSGLSGDAVTRFEQLRASLVSPSQVAIAKEELALLENAFEELPDEHREVITLHRIVGMSHKEIAEQMGRSEDATRQLLRRAMIRLGKLIQRAEGDD